MGNQLTLNAPMVIAPLKYITVVEANGINDTTKQFVLKLALYADGGVRFPNIVEFLVSDGECDRMQVNAEPQTTQDVFVIDRVTTSAIPAVAQAFSNALGLYFQAAATGVPGAGNNAILGYLQAISLLPAGSVG